MAKNDNAHVLRMNESLKKYAGEEYAKAFEEKYPLSKSANIDKKYEWAKNTCDYLEEHFDENTIIKIRQACCCNDGKSIAKKIEKYLNKAESIEGFVKQFNENETFASMEYLSEHKILFCYPECYCACIKRIPKELSKTWCYCTLGNAKGIFKEVFNKEVEVKLVESIKAGASKCIIEVVW